MKWLDKYDAPKAQNGIEGTMSGLTDKGFNYNGAWGGQFKEGGQVSTTQEGTTKKPLNTKPKVMTSKDSVAHQADKILKYEQLRGGPGGTPLSYYSDPQYMDMLMSKIYPEVQKIMPKASAMEAGEAMDFIFNAGWDKVNNKITKDPRAFALQEYYRQYDPSKLDKDGKWSGRKNPAYSFDKEYANTIGKLPENKRRILMNKGRDWYYQNINNPSPGVPSSDYNDTWYGRIWNTNDFQPFNPKNPKFIPIRQEGGEIPMAQNGKKKKPLYVDSRNDPRYRAYQDSLKAFNSTDHFRRNLPEGAMIKNINDPDLQYETHVYDEYLYKKLKPYAAVTYGYTKEFPLYKKPEQQVIVQSKPVKITPKGHTVNKKEIKGNSNVRPQAKLPKYFNVTDKVNQPFGGTETQYRSYSDQTLPNISTQKYPDGTPMNTRKMVPVYQQGGSMFKDPSIPQVDYSEPTYSYPLREKLYPGEDEYFKANPHVGGMAAEDNTVIINPYSKLTDQQKEGIRINETARLAMRNGYRRPDFELTPEQQGAFKNYSTDIQDQKETIIGRILSGDTSAGNVTPEQKKYAEQLKKVLKLQNGDAIGSRPEDMGIREITEFEKAYINSPRFTELSRKQGDTPEITQRRRDTINNFNIDRDVIRVSEGPSYISADEKGTPKFYLSPDKGDWPSHLDINAHEMGHFPYNTGDLNFPENTYREIQSRNKEFIKSKKTGVVDENIEHDINPNEVRADKNQLLYQLKKLGIYDATKDGDINQEQLDEFKNSGEWNRLQRLYDDADILWLINNVAQNTPNEELNIAQTGASIPGSVGFTYARTQDIPSEGKYAKKTMPSAQNGQEMKYYQHGLDWKPKGMKNGGWLDSYDVPKAQNGETWMGTKLNNQGIITSETKGGNRIAFTGNQRSDDWINKQIDSGKFGFDPKTGGTVPLKKPVKGLSKEDQFKATRTYSSLVQGQGFNTDAQLAQIKKLPKWQQQIVNDANEKRRKDYVAGNMEEVIHHPLMSPGYFTPEGVAIGALQGAAKLGPDLYEGNYLGAAGDLLMTLPVTGPYIGKGLTMAGRALGTEEGLLSNAYKYNPWAFKPNPEAYYHRSPNLENIINQETGTLQGFGQSEAGKAYSELAKPGMGNTLLSDGRVSRLNLRKPANSSLYFSKGVPLDYGRYNPETFNEAGKRIMTGQGYPGPYMVSVEGVPMGASTKGRLPGAEPIGLEAYAVSKRPIFLDEAKFYKEDWLRGYKPIEVPKQNNIKPSFIKQDLSEGNNIKYSFTDDQGNNIGTFSGRKTPEGVYVNSIEINPELRRQGLASKIYKDIAKDLQSKNEGTLFSRSTQHQFTDKDELGRSIAPANKLWENLVNKGEAEKFVEGMSHTYKIKPLKKGGVIKDDRGQWAHPGEITQINSPYITMKGVPYRVLGISNTGDMQMMYPEEEYEFDGDSVTEYPMAKNGINNLDARPLRKLDDLTNFTNYNSTKKSGWLSKYE